MNKIGLNLARMAWPVDSTINMHDIVKKAMHVLTVSWGDVLMFSSYEIEGDQVHSTFVGSDKKKIDVYADMVLAQMSGDPLSYLAIELGLTLCAVYGLRDVRYDTV
jgi:hypothetical protein